MPNAKISLNVVQFKSEDDVFRTQSILLIITRNKKKVIQCCKFQYFTTDQHWLSASFWITVTLLLEYLFCAFKTTWAEQLFSEPIRFSFLLIPWVQYTRFWKVRVEKYFIFRKMKKTFITSVLVTVWGTCMVSQMFQSTSVKVSKREFVFSFFAGMFIRYKFISRRLCDVLLWRCLPCSPSWFLWPSASASWNFLFSFLTWRFWHPYYCAISHLGRYGRCSPWLGAIQSCCLFFRSGVLRVLWKCTLCCSAVPDILIETHGPVPSKLTSPYLLLESLCL